MVPLLIMPSIGPPGFEANPENVNVIPDPACGFGCIANQPQGSFFQAIEDYGFFLYYGPLDFAGLGGNVLVTNEAEPPATTAGTLLVTYNPVTNAYDTTVFDPIFNFTINEGAQFVECDAVTPTPTPTATSTPTSTLYATTTFYELRLLLRQHLRLQLRQRLRQPTPQLRSRLLLQQRLRLQLLHGTLQQHQRRLRHRLHRDGSVRSRRPERLVHSSGTAWPRPSSTELQRQQWEGRQ